MTIKSIFRAFGVLVTSGMMFSANAADISLDMDTYNADPGEQVSVTVNYDFTDLPAFGGGFNLIYDANVLEFVSYTQAVFSGSGAPQVGIASPLGAPDSPGNYLGAGVGTFEFFTGNNTAGAIGTFVFTVLGTGGDGGCGATLCLTPVSINPMVSLAGADITAEVFANGITAGNINIPVVPDSLTKEIISGPQTNNEFDVVVEVGQLISTRYDFKVSYTNLDGPPVLIEDTVPAEWNVQLLDVGSGRATVASANKKGKGKGATKIDWEPDPAGGMITVWADTRQKRRNGKFSPTACGALYLNDGAQAFEIDAVTLEPKVDEFGERLPPILESNQLCLAAVSDIDGGGIVPDGSGDEDTDGLTDLAEACEVGTDPCVDDTDGDGVLDGDDVCPLEAAVVDEDGDGCEDPNLIFECNTDITELTMRWDGTQTIDVIAWYGNVGSTVLHTQNNVTPGTEVKVSGYANSPVEVYWEVFSGSTKIGESNFHLSCSDDEMNGAEDCGNHEGNGKGNNSGFINDWILEGMVDADGPFDCSDLP